MNTITSRLIKYTRYWALGALLVGSTLSQAYADSLHQLNVGYQKANIFSLLKARGTLDKALEKEGIHVNWIQFPAGPQMLEGLNVGSIDLAATGDAPPAFAQAAQANLVYLGHSPANPQTEAIIVPANSPIKTVADLKGKRVALNKGSDVNYLLVKALQKNGLSYNDIQPEYLTPDDALAAFRSGDIDAWAIWDPYLAFAQSQEHAREITTAQGLVPHYTFYLATRQFADKYPKVAEEVIQQLEATSKWSNTHQQQTAQLLSQATGLSQDIWSIALKRMPFGAERMTNQIYNAQQSLADTFTQARLIPVKVNVRSAVWAADKQALSQH
ncbi:putative aliphatic sulfonates-binding protein [Halomonadaceae bacterium LMG 33818]|uniref:aliphatic sulfonate ABC transporter substrate-binding protein n=1 Tax=Cernens ardua TaxID=3402176 RepID=UPI003EDC94CD